MSTSINELPNLPDDYGLLSDALEGKLAASDLHDEVGRSLVRLGFIVREYFDALDACDTSRLAPDSATRLDRLRRAEATLRHVTAPVPSRRGFCVKCGVVVAVSDGPCPRCGFDTVESIPHQEAGGRP